MKTITILAACALALAATNSTLRADTFGTTGDEFTIDFVNIGNPGNGGSASGYGGVSYQYRIGVTEVPQHWITKATNLGMTNVTAGAWSGSQPAANMTWYEAAAFVNYLNTSTGHQAAYDLIWTGTEWTMSLWSSAQAWQADGENLYRHRDAYYFLPSEDEWSKAAYHKNVGVTANDFLNYWFYPMASDARPDGIDFSGDTAFDAVFAKPFVQAAPNEVTNVGLASAYGTIGQGGNIEEWAESAFDGSNNSSVEWRAMLGGGWFSPESALSNSGSNRANPAPNEADIGIGFRVASIPEPSSALLFVGSGCLLLLRRQRGTPSQVAAELGKKGSGDIS